MSILTLIQNICIMYCNRPYEIFAMSSPNYVTKRKYSVTLDFDVYEDSILTRSTGINYSKSRGKNI